MLTVPLISATKAYKLIGTGCTAYLCRVKTSDTQEPDLKSIPWYKNFQKSSRKYRDHLLTVRLSLP